MSVRLNVGDRWGCLCVVDRDVQSEDSEKYEGSGIRRVFLVVCTCGKQFKVFSDGEMSTGGVWCGKRLNRDCGCGESQGGRHTNMSISLSLKTVILVREYADKQRVSFSQALGELAKMGLDYHSLME